MAHIKLVSTDSAGDQMFGDSRLVSFSDDAGTVTIWNYGWFGGGGFVKDLATGLATRSAVTDRGELSQSLSGDGRFGAFTSSASDLVAGDTNGSRDVFVKDLVSGETIRVSTDSAGNEANGPSLWTAPSISANGRYVAFSSSATNLVENDTNGSRDIFVKDLVTGATRRVSTDSAGLEANDDSWSASISGDGRFVAFCSNAPNLVPDKINPTSDIFVKDLVTGVTTRVSTDSADRPVWGTHSSPSISADGHLVAFASNAPASKLAEGNDASGGGVFVKDLATGTTTLVSTGRGGDAADGWSMSPSLSADGRFVAFESRASNLVWGDKNNGTDVFIRDLATGVGSDHADRLFGGDGYDRIYAGAGDDVAYSGAGGDRVHGNAGNDVLFGNAGNDGLFGGDGKDILAGGSGDDVLDGGAGTDAVGYGASASAVTVDLAAGIAEGEGRDLLHSVEEVLGSRFDDVIKGDSGDNWFHGRLGDDVLDGGAGFDSASYVHSANGVAVDLAKGLAVGEGTDHLSDIEAVIGSAFDDTLIGDAGSNRLVGGAGDDSLAGGDGRDFLAGGSGNDILDGGAGTDTLSYASADAGVIVDLAAGTAVGEGHDLLHGFEEVRGSRFDDLIKGDAGDNWLHGGLGDDTLDGGAGTDTASYVHAAGGVAVDLSTGAASGEGDDSLIDMENVAGSRFGDVIGGDAGANWLSGDAGDDVIVGGAGADTLRGGAGADRLDGGAGNDWLVGGEGGDVFAFAPTVGAAGDMDHIADFGRLGYDSGSDRIDLEAFGFADKAEVLALMTSVGDDLLLDLRGAGGSQVIIDQVSPLQAEHILI